MTQTEFATETAKRGHKFTPTSRKQRNGGCLIMPFVDEGGASIILETG